MFVNLRIFIVVNVFFYGFGIFLIYLYVDLKVNSLNGGGMLPICSNVKDQL